MLPTSLRIGPYLYRVFEGVPKKKTSVGTHRSRKSEIVIRAGMSPDNNADTLLHEVLHGVFHVSGLNTTVEELDPNLEEHIVKTMSPFLLMVLRANPQLINYLLNP